MTNVRNELPVAVHIQSGGDARVRTGGVNIALNGTSTASFQVSNGTRFRLLSNMRTTVGALVLVGYANPVSLSNASSVMGDLNEFIDDIPEGTTVYCKVVDQMTLDPVVCGVEDFLNVSFYG